jgi:hypothetical protein
MKQTVSVFLFATILFTACKSKDKDKDRIATDKTKAFYNKDFDWTIYIPAGFTEVPAEEWAKMQNKGLNAMEKTVGGNVDLVENKNIFVYRNGRSNYFEANQQGFDSSTDGNYMEIFHAISDVTYSTLYEQTGGASIDTSFGVETIDGLEFQRFQLKMQLKSDVYYHVLMFSHLFGKKEFAVNIMYVENKIGQQMLDAFRQSKFGKRSE